jgi:hypothetical protein
MFPTQRERETLSLSLSLSLSECGHQSQSVVSKLDRPGDLSQLVGTEVAPEWNGLEKLLLALARFLLRISDEGKPKSGSSSR